jgi:thioredoxin-dependent peroxiredoxin
VKLIIYSLLVCATAFAVELKPNDTAPTFRTLTHEGNEFSLGSRIGKWTVLYFYPKADTPGCTKQACAFRDSLAKIRALDADVFGVSADSVAAQAIFHKKNHLNFTLLADPDGSIVEAYGAKMPMLKMAKRWTFIIDPDLRIREIQKDVDPVKDADRVAAKITQLRNKK